MLSTYRVENFMNCVNRTDTCYLRVDSASICAAAGVSLQSHGEGNGRMTSYKPHSVDRRSTHMFIRVEDV